ncbi:MAG: hypothetical protein QF890_08345 [Myxococcota bacterium]|nr:hypothetical protein [Myxococcota bacterium]MDP7432565.1 hypothetical protein [Myxococcota bacterium]HJO23945.1 hypothetical protein [Myxococcota bacterium]
MRKVLLGLLAAVAVGLGAVWFYVDEIVAHAIERGGSAALGVEIRVGFVRISPLNGELLLSGVGIANPPGFDSSDFLRILGGRIDADLRTLLEDEVVEVPYLGIEHVAVSLDRDQKQTNYQVILENLKHFEAVDPSGASKSDGSEKRFVVRKVQIRDVTARVEWSRVASKQTAISVVVPEIELHDLGAEGGQGVTMAEFSSIFTRAILGSIARYGFNLPSDVRSGLELGLGGLTRVTGVVVKGTGTTLVDVAAGVATGVAGERAGDAVSNAGGGVVGGIGEAVEDVGALGTGTVHGVGEVLDAGGKKVLGGLERAVGAGDRPDGNP